jgi:hypothetical protein
MERGLDESQQPRWPDLLQRLRARVHWPARSAERKDRGVAVTGRAKLGAVRDHVNGGWNRVVQRIRSEAEHGCGVRSEDEDISTLADTFGRRGGAQHGGDAGR